MVRETDHPESFTVSVTAMTFFFSFSEGFPNINAMAAGTEAKAKADEYAPLPKAGEKCWISGDYLIYEFDKKPQMGTIILKIRFSRKMENRIVPWRSWATGHALHEGRP
jgi:hypothetical protein